MSLPEPLNSKICEGIVVTVDAIETMFMSGDSSVLDPNGTYLEDETEVEADPDALGMEGSVAACRAIWDANTFDVPYCC